MTTDAQQNEASTNDLFREILDAGFGEGEPLNWFAAQAERPDILQTTWALTKGLLMQGELPATVKQMICLAISERNGCSYCRVVHANVLGSLGVPYDAIQACVSDPNFSSLPPVQRAVLHFAVKAAKTPNDIDEEDRQSLRDVGLNSREIMEVVMMAAFTNFINTWADAGGVAID